MNGTDKPADHDPRRRDGEPDRPPDDTARRLEGEDRNGPPPPGGSGPSPQGGNARGAADWLTETIGFTVPRYWLVLAAAGVVLLAILAFD